MSDLTNTIAVAGMAGKVNRSMRRTRGGSGMSSRGHVQSKSTDFTKRIGAVLTAFSGAAGRIFRRKVPRD